MSLTQAERIEAIHKSPYRGVFAITGGGNGAIGELQKRGGSSATILEVTVPYATQSFINYVGGTPAKFCSSEGARALAMASYQRSTKLDDGKNPSYLFGIGVSCSLAKGKKEEERAGRENHAWVAVQTSTTTHVQRFVLVHDDREQQEELVSKIIIDVLYSLCTHQRSNWVAAEENKTLGTGEEQWLLKGHTVARTLPPESLILSGSFNPIHEGHLKMANLASKLLEKPVHFELCIRNAEKPPLDFMDMDRRQEAMKSAGVTSILLSNASTFVEKAAIYQSPIFVVGPDTWNRLFDRKYYGNSSEAMQHAIDRLELLGAQFVVFGRVDATGEFQTVEPHPLIKRVISEAEFRSDTSSTQLRASKNG